MRLSAADQAFLVRIGRHIEAHGDDVEQAIATLSDEDRRHMLEIEAQVAVAGFTDADPAADDVAEDFDDAEPDVDHLRRSLAGLPGVEELANGELLRAHERLLEILLANMTPNKTVSEQFSEAQLLAFWREALKAAMS
jgi:hypothetical protein